MTHRDPASTGNVSQNQHCHQMFLLLIALLFLSEEFSKERCEGDYGEIYEMQFAVAYPMQVWKSEFGAVGGNC